VPVKVPPEKRTLQTAGKQAARRVFFEGWKVFIPTAARLFAGRWMGGAGEAAFHTA
jgi:hypothetical protein